MIFQKALSPAHVALLVEGNYDTVSGYVLNAADVAGVQNPTELFQAHGLGFPGSPWDSGADFLDVLRFGEPPVVYIHTPVAPGFVDRPPFTGTGFTSWDGGGVAPLYFLDEVRIPAGAELWRIRVGRPEQLLAVYRDVAAGWAVVEGADLGEPRENVPEVILGWVGVWDGYRFSADLVKEDTVVVLAAASEPPVEVAGFTRTGRGCWRREVPVGEMDDLFELNATCCWREQPFRITGVEQGEDGQRHFRLFYTGHNADVAESLGLNKSDAGVYWTVVPESETAGLELIQNHLKGLLPRR